MFSLGLTKLVIKCKPSACLGCQWWSVLETDTTCGEYEFSAKFRLATQSGFKNNVFISLTWQTFCLGFQVCFYELGDDKQQIFQSCAVVVYLLFNYLLCGTKDCFPHRYFSWVLICFRLTSALFWNENTRDNLKRNWWLLPVTQCNYSAFKGLFCLPVTRRT